MNDNNHTTWKRRWTFILAATGSAVGLGNIWRFPYVVGEYGGGAFVLVYLACILLIGVPVMIAESMIGRAGRTDPIHSCLKLSQAAGSSRAWAGIGLLGVVTGAIILMFYSVVAGWSLDYISQSFNGEYIGASASAIEANFTALTDDKQRQITLLTLFILLTGLVVAGEVTRGIGNAVEILMPLLFVFLLVLVGYSMATGDFAAALQFLFAFDFSKLGTEAVLVAMGQAFFTLSLGMGAIMAYGSYMPGGISIGKTAVTVALLDTVVAIVAGLAIFPLVFANGLEPGSGPGLMFVSLPIAFANMPAGIIFGSLFFILVGIAALSSSISLIEPFVAWMEKNGLKRPFATLLIIGVGWLGAVACVYYGALFNTLDHITTNYMLPLGGLLITLFVGWIMKVEAVRKAVAMDTEVAFQLWHFVLRYLTPAGVIIIFMHSLGLI